LNKVIPFLAFSILLLVPVGAQDASAGPIKKQVPIEDLGILQLAAHDFFLVVRD